MASEPTTEIGDNVIEELTELGKNDSPEEVEGAYEKLVKELQEKYGISKADVQKLLEVANGLSEKKQSMSLTCGLSDKSDPDADSNESCRRRAAKAGGESESATSSKGVDKGEGQSPTVLQAFAKVLVMFRPDCKGKGKGKDKDTTLKQVEIDDLIGLRRCINLEPKSEEFEIFYNTLRDQILTPHVWTQPTKSYKELNLYEKIKAALFFLAIAKKEGFERYSDLEQVLLNLLRISSLSMAHVQRLENMQSSAHRLAHTLLNVICSTKKAESFTNRTMENLAKVKKFEIDTWWDTGSSCKSPYPPLENEEDFNLDLVATIQTEIKNTIIYAELPVWGDW
ncbi:MAG: hypothetical protein EBS06_09110 [Proteobacteria bacterium]|nr:hypothetical protein [Pseudomonadota bacterium]